MLNFSISKEAYDLLLKIGNNGAAEYRDTRYSTLEEFKNSDLYKDGLRSEQSFLDRNYGGTYYLIDELEKYNLVESDGQSWHLTFVLTGFGKEMIQKSNESFYSEEEVESLLVTQRGNCYVAILTETRNEDLAKIAGSAPEPGGGKWRK